MDEIKSEPIKEEYIYDQKPSTSRLDVPAWHPDSPDVKIKLENPDEDIQTFEDIQVVDYKEVKCEFEFSPEDEDAAGLQYEFGECSYADVPEDQVHFQSQTSANARDPLDSSDLEAVIEVEERTFFERNFVCKTCYKLFPSLHLLNIHITVHEKCIIYNPQHQKQLIEAIKPYECDDCDFNCMNSRYLKREKNLRINEDIVKCISCNFESGHYSEIQKHYNSTHIVYKCDACSYRCNHLGRFKGHQTTHAGRKHPECDFCDYDSIRIEKLKTIQHSVKKVSECDDCDYKCNEAHPSKLQEMRYTRANLVRNVTVVTSDSNCDGCDFNCG